MTDVFNLTVMSIGIIAMVYLNLKLINTTHLSITGMPLSGLAFRYDHLGEYLTIIGWGVTTVIPKLIAYISLIYLNITLLTHVEVRGGVFAYWVFVILSIASAGLMIVRGVVWCTMALHAASQLLSFIKVTYNRENKMIGITTLEDSEVLSYKPKAKEPIEDLAIKANTVILIMMSLLVFMFVVNV